MAKEIHKRISLWLNQQGIENDLKSVRAAISKTANELAKLPIGTEEWYRKSEKLKKLKDIQQELRKETELTAKAVAEHNEKLNDTIVAAGAISAVYATASSAIRRFVSTAQEYVDAYSRMDDAMTNVSKYTGLTREEVKQLNEEFRKMDTRTPTEKLNALAADAGRLGITSKEAIKDFVEAADIINVALGEDLGEDAVKNIGKMAQMFGESDRMGLRGAMLSTASAVNTLAQSSSASEPYIMEVSSRLAGVANAAGMTQAQIMGLASALDQNMAQAEKSATALQKFILGMTSATDKYAEIAGMTVDKFRQVMEQDMNQALVSVIDGFKRIQDTGGISALNTSLDELKLKGSGIKETLTSLVMHTDQLKEAQQLATQAYADGNSVIDEAAAVNGNAAAQLEKAKKAVEDAKAALGEQLLPVITKLTQMSASGLKVAAEMTKFLINHKGLVIGLGIAYGALHKAQKLVIAAGKEKNAITLKNMAVGKAYKSVVMLLAAAKAKLAGATGAAALAQKQFKAAFASTPWGAIIVAIGAIAKGIGTLISKQREAAKTMNEFTASCISEQREARYLIDRLKKTEEGTDDYKRALERLKERYPEIIQKHIDEEGKLRNIEAAYKDIIKQMQSKYAIDARQKEFDKINEKYTKDMVSDYENLRAGFSKKFGEEQAKDMQDTISTMIEEGKTAGEILQELKNKYGYETVVDKAQKSSSKNVKYDKYGFEIPQQTINNDPVFKYLKELEKQHKNLNKEIDKTKKKYSPFIEESDSEKMEELESKLSKIREDMNNYQGDKVKSEYQNMLMEERRLVGEISLLEKKMKEQKKLDNKQQDATASNMGDKEEEEQKETLRKKEAFYKKMADMEHKDSVAALNDWERIKAEIHKKHQDLIDESEQLFGKNNKYIQQIQGMEAQALSAAADKYLQKTKDFAANFATEIDKMLADTQADSGQPQSRLVTAIAGSDAQWDKAIKKAQENADAIERILNDMDESDPEWNKFAIQLAEMQDQIDDAIQKKTQARTAITQKFVEEESKALAKREKEQQRQLALTRKGITEEEKVILQRQWKIEDLNEEYDIEIKLMEAALVAKEKLNDGDEEGIENIRKMIAQLKKLKENVEATVDAAEGGKTKKRTGNDLIDLITGNITDPKERFQAVINVMQDFANQAMDIYRQIADVQQQSAELEMQRFSEAQDAKGRKLKQQLDDGLISQKYYDAQMEKMEAEKERREKKMKHDQFEKEKQASIVQSVIQGALSVATTIAQWGLPWGLIPAAIAAATAAVQTALIASQPNPYYRGGFIRGRQYAVMGERGPEWVASNSLLEDPETAPIIDALESYQRGNRQDLTRLLHPTEPNWKNLSQSASDISSNFVASRTPVVHNHYLQAESSEVLDELKRMNQFLADPKNRQAYISYKIQTEADTNRDFIKKAARL